MDRWISGIIIPKVIVYENFKLGLAQSLLTFLAVLFWLWFVVWEMHYVTVVQPFGAVTFSTGANASYAVDTASYGYCAASAVDGCAILEPQEALLGAGTSPGTLFVNTKVVYTQETCAACSSSDVGWASPVSSAAATSALYTASKTATYLVAGVEDYEVTVNHGVGSPWGRGGSSSSSSSSAVGREGDAWGMAGVLLGPGGWSDEPLMTFEKGAYDVMPVSQLLAAAGVDLCATATGCADDSSGADDPRVSGATLLVELKYTNLVGWADWASKLAYADALTYAYKVSVVDGEQGDGVGAPTVTEVHPDLNRGPYGYARVKVARTGVTVVFRVTGTVGKWSFYEFWVACVAGAAMLALAHQLFALGARVLVCDANLAHKLATAREAASELFVYSSSANKQADGTFAAVDAKAVLKPEVELSEYQKRKGIQRQVSRTKLDQGLYGNGLNGGGGWGDDDDDEHNPADFSPVHGRGGGRKPVPIGTKIKREFPGYGVYDGTVVEYKKPYYRVVYPDGDSEQLLGRELRPLIQASHL